MTWGLLTFLLAYTLSKLEYFKFPILPAILLLLLVFVRQIHLWAALPIVVAAFCTPAANLPTRLNPLENAKILFTSALRKRVLFALAAIAMVIPSFILIYMFIKLCIGHSAYVIRPIDKPSTA